VTEIRLSEIATGKHAVSFCNLLFAPSTKKIQSNAISKEYYGKSLLGTQVVSYGIHLEHVTL
jgi:hypothetical protein